MIALTWEENDFNRYIAALDNVANAIRDEKRNLPYRCAVDFSNLLLQQISSQAYQLASNRKRYREWKLGRVSHLDHWILDGDLVSSITAFRHGTGWMGGIPSGVYDKGGKSWYGGGPPKEISRYARWLEYGRTGQPERPVVQPTTVLYRNHGYLKQLRLTKRNVESKWK